MINQEGLDIKENHATNDVKKIEFVVVLRRTWCLLSRSPSRLNRKPSRNIHDSITRTRNGKPDHVTAFQYHRKFILPSHHPYFPVGLSNGIACFPAACDPVLHLLFNLVAIPNAEHWDCRNLRCMQHLFRPIVTLFYPESADFTLEDIDRLFRDNVPCICFPG